MWWISVFQVTLTTAWLREKESFSFWDKEKLRKNRWLEFGLVNIHKAEKKRTEKDIIIYFSSVNLRSLGKTLSVCLNLSIASLFCFFFNCPDFPVRLDCCFWTALHWTLLNFSGISYLRSSQAFSGLTAAACELITVCIHAVLCALFCPGLFYCSFFCWTWTLSVQQISRCGILKHVLKLRLLLQKFSDSWP